MNTMEEERYLQIAPRERELVRLIAQGFTEKVCAERMGVSANTVKHLADKLRYKLGVRDRRQIPMAFWRQTGEDPFPEDD